MNEGDLLDFILENKYILRLCYITEIFVFLLAYEVLVVFCFGGIMSDEVTVTLDKLAERVEKIREYL